MLLKPSSVVLLINKVYLVRRYNKHTSYSSRHNDIWKWDRKRQQEDMADEERRQPGTSEEEPLLGGPGDASQEKEQPLYYNFWLGMLDAHWRQKTGHDVLTKGDRYRSDCSGWSMDCKHSFLGSYTTK